MKNLILVLFSCAPITGIITILLTPLGVISVVALIVTFATALNIGIIITVIAIIFITLAIVVAIDITKELKVKKGIVLILLFLEIIVFWVVFYFVAVFS